MRNNDKSSFFLKAAPLFLAIFIDGLGLGIFFPILNSLLIDPTIGILSPHTSLVARNFLYGVVISVFMLMWFFGSAIFGDLSDNIGRRKVLCICLGGDFIGYFLSGLAVVFRSVTLLLLGRIISGFTSGSQPIAQAAIIDMSTPVNKAKHLGYIMLFSALGFLLGPLIGGFLSDHQLVHWFSFATPLYFASLLALLNTFLVFFLFKETLVHKRIFNIKLTYAIDLFASAFKDKSVRQLSVVLLLMIFGWSTYMSFISLFLLKRYHYSSVEVSIFWSVLALGYLTGFAYVLGKVAHFKRKHVALVGFSVTGVGVLLTVLIHHAVYAWILTVILGMGNGVGYTALLTMFSDQVDASKQGWVMGITGSVIGLGFAVIMIVLDAIRTEITHFNFTPWSL